jgi:thiol:disulfide interchange protein
MKILAAILIAAAPLAAQMSANWEHEFVKAQKRARSEKKLIFMDLWAEWCGPCLKLQRDTFPHPMAVSALDKVVPLSVLVQKRDRTNLPEGSSLAEKYNLEAYPTLLMLDENGKEIRRFVGYLDAAGLVKFIQGK